MKVEARLTIEHIRSFLSTYQRKENNDEGLIRAGVLVLLFEDNGEPSVVLTKRTDDVEHHKGQISFPGGAMDDADATIIETALRETEEEIGLSRDAIEVAGVLSDFCTPSGFRVTPVVAILPSIPRYLINPKEVAEVFSVPLSFFLHAQNERVEHRNRQGLIVPVYYYQYGVFEIWGATAAIVRSFVHSFVEWLTMKKAL